MDDEMTNIKVTKATKEKFDKLGNLSMTQDDVVNSLVDFWNRYQGVVNK